MRKLDQTLKQHEELIDKHEDKIDRIQSDVNVVKQDLTDVKTRLGIKDLTNGQVVEYQKQLVKAIEDEKVERKEQDGFLRDDIKDIRNITWMIMISVVFAILLEIVSIISPRVLEVLL